MLYRQGLAGMACLQPVLHIYARTQACYAHLFIILGLFLQPSWGFVSQDSVRIKLLNVEESASKQSRFFPRTHETGLLIARISHAEGLSRYFGHYTPHHRLHGPASGVSALRVLSMPWGTLLPGFAPALSPGVRRGKAVTVSRLTFSSSAIFSAGLGWWSF